MGRTLNKSDSNKTFNCAEVLYNLSYAIYLHLDMAELMKATVSEMIQLFGVDAIKIYLLDPETKILSMRSHQGFSNDSVGSETLSVGDGFAKKVATSGILSIHDQLSREQDQKLKSKQNEILHVYIGIPLKHKDKIYGVLELYFKEANFSLEKNRELLLEIGECIGMAVNNSLLFEKASIRAKRFITISRAITVTRQLGSLNQVLQDITRVLVQSLGFDQSWIGLLNEEENSVEGKACFGEGKKNLNHHKIFTLNSNSTNPVIMAVMNKKPIIYPFNENSDNAGLNTWSKKLQVQSYGYIPILSSEKSLGVIGLFHFSDQKIQEEDIKSLISVSEHAAIAIENAKLYEQIRTSEERYRTLFESTGTSVVILDENQRFRLVNHAFEVLSSLPRETLIGKMSLTPFLAVKSSQVKDIIEKLNNPPQNWEAEFSQREEQPKQVYISTTRMPGSNHTLVTLIDMTRERELEKQLYQSKELAAIGELSAGIAHEIRNPLVAITNSVGLLQEEPNISQEGYQLLDVVKEESNHLAVIVDDFLKFARPKKPNIKAENINQLLKDVLKRCREMNKKNIQWIEEYDSHIKTIYIDKHQIQQVVTNLVKNGLDAIKIKGLLKIETKLEKKPDNDLVRITITDSGAGIPKNRIPKIFQPFYSTKEEGTGMGLAICHRIIMDHHGKIVVDSEEGMGTSFTILLPNFIIKNENSNN